MPYIPQEQRALRAFKPESTGELNYRITLLVDRYLGPDLSYQKINDVIGVLECAKLELYRRIAAPYEDLKMAANGDVYTTQVLK